MEELETKRDPQAAERPAAGVRLGVVAPHPPLLIPEVGRGHLERVSATVQGMQEMAREVKAAGEVTVVLISPHGPVFRDGVAVVTAPELAGDFRGFGSRERLSFRNDPELAAAILEELGLAGLTGLKLDEETARRFGLDGALDHGTLVPMHFLGEAGVDRPLVPLGMSLLPPEELLKVGAAIERAAVRLGRAVVLVASGDLSHRLTADAPAGYDPAGKEFDRKLVSLLRRGDVEALAGMDETMREAAGDCGYRSILMMLGAFGRGRVETKVLSYEGPFGVGYCVALVYPPATAAREAGAGGDPFVALAREAIKAYVTDGAVLDPPDPLPAEFRGEAGVFVSLHKFGELRGCIGTTGPTEPDLARQIIRNAIYAATDDPRFEPVDPSELEDLEISVDVLSPAEPIPGPEQLDPKVYGVIVRHGYRSGLLLPDLEGIDTVEEQVEIARRKAGIGPDEPVQLFRFRVVRHH